MRALLLAALVAAAPLHAEESSTPATASTSPVDLNTASVEVLCGLPGIGPKKALAIVAYRNKHAFTRVTQLLEVHGIGRRTLERLRPLVAVREPPPAQTGS